MKKWLTFLRKFLRKSSDKEIINVIVAPTLGEEYSEDPESIQPDSVGRSRVLTLYKSLCEIKIRFLVAAIIGGWPNWLEQLLCDLYTQWLAKIDPEIAAKVIASGDTNNTVDDFVSFIIGYLYKLYPRNKYTIHMYIVTSRIRFKSTKQTAKALGCKVFHIESGEKGDTLPGPKQLQWVFHLVLQFIAWYDPLWTKWIGNIMREKAEKRAAQYKEESRKFLEKTA